MIALFHRHKACHVAAAIAFVALIAPTIVNYTPFYPAWDDSYFFAHALCVVRSLNDLSLQAFHNCQTQIYKSPLMSLMGVPWAWIGVNTASVGLALFTLTVAIFGAAGFVAFILRRAGVGWPSLLLVALCLASNHVMTSRSGAFLVDHLFSWVVALTLLLPLLENEKAPDCTKAYIWRGVLWGVVAGLGILGKVTYGLFAPFLLIVLWRRWYISGRKAALTSAVAAVVVGLPALLMWVFYGPHYMEHATNASFGAITRFWFIEGTEGVNYFPFLARESGWGMWPLGALTLLAFGHWLSFKNRSWLALLPLVPLIAYIVITACSPNRDVRFAMPLIVGLPCVLAAMTIRKPIKAQEGISLTPYAWIPAAMALLLSVPMVGMVDMTYVNQNSEALEWFANQGVHQVMVASDGRLVNINTMQLAAQLQAQKLGLFEVSTVVYDDIRGVDKTVTLQKIAAAPGLFFEIPLPVEPEYTNTNTAAFYQKAHEAGFMPATSTGNHAGWLVKTK